jgi:hypothetical protein
MIWWEGHLVCIGMINAYFINYEGKRPARRRSRRLEYNIIVDFTESGFRFFDSSGSRYGTVSVFYEQGIETSGYIK